MIINQTLSFKKSIKKLHVNQKKELDKAVRELIENPLIGEEKKGDLSHVRVHKFKMNKILALLAYEWEDSARTLTLLKLGTHENFYRDLKKESSS
jgi:hypothetical protein